MENVLVGMSGGVDSAVAAYMLKQQGFEVIGVHLIIQEDETQRVAEIAEKLSIKYKVLDVRKEFEREIVDYFVKSYRNGLTPNPCALCNRDIKLRFMIEIAEKMSIKLIATGHYLRVINGIIYRGIDKTKDQSYFLALVPLRMTRRLIAPLGELRKKDVIDIATEIGISGTVSPESQDVCFLKGTDLSSFLRERIGDIPGEIIGPDGKTIGTHPGTHYYTIGQRRGLGVALGERAYVRKIDPIARRLYLGRSAKFSIIEVGTLNWFVKPESKFRAEVKIRQLHRAAPAIVELREDKAIVRFDTPQWAPTPGQVAAFYIGDKLIGGGIIESYLDQR